MEITLEAVDQVRERTGVSYSEAKEALEKSNGNVVDAIVALEEASKPEEKTNAIVEKLKKAFKDGNVTKIQMKKDDKVILSIPVNVGLVGGVVGASLAPWAIIPAALAAYGFDCKFELIKDDGSTEDVD
ncbi:MAG: DUF4342 domain-containing protein [Butyrivibrio sp.]|nr:DUF4342 domain-containing protein [Butyrivibrio sp.]